MMDDRLVQLSNHLNVLQLQVDGAKMGTKAVNWDDVIEAVIEIMKLLQSHPSLPKSAKMEYSSPPVDVSKKHESPSTSNASQEESQEGTLPMNPFKEEKSIPNPVEEENKDMRQKENPLLRFQKPKNEEEKIDQKVENEKQSVLGVPEHKI
jgi:hypothetical protein